MGYIYILSPLPPSLPLSLPPSLPPSLSLSEQPSTPAPQHDDCVTFQLADVFSSLDYSLSSQLIEFCPSHLDDFAFA